MKPIKTFDNPKELLAFIGRKFRHNPKSWTKHAFARKANRRHVPSLSPAAVCFCAEGAIKRFADPLAVDARMEARSALKAVTGMEIIFFNDAQPRKTGHKIVAKAFLDAAASL